MREQPTAMCLRCGVINQVRWNQTRDYVCRDCKLKPLHAVARGLPDGRWVLVGGIRRFVPSGSTKIGRPRKPPRYPWSLDEAKRAHREYVKGNRTPWSREGERMYSRWAKTRQKAARQEAA